MNALPPVPSYPNAVSSQADPSDRLHYIAPIVAADALERAIQWLAANERGQVIERGPSFAHVVVTTRWLRFKDDVHLLWDGAALQIRSASRLGKGDLGANRKRMEALRAALVNG
jgi:uncharacterized protein (DUF1499 family)